ncbi:hypothetical protein EDC52_1171 [Biostraticola tofi]|uniref:Uncharacterized protein n=1 Tax=Biostraticola tofi TaxID=466109 RepID=A0A4R3YJC9_9GAMM|nr:hypothetical protein EDC52_1171 [Biostraticola tofi]
MRLHRPVLMTTSQSIVNDKEESLEGLDSERGRRNIRYLAQD